MTLKFPSPLLTITSLASGGERLRGPLPAEQREIIEYLAAHHQECKREVEWSVQGYTATTTSTNQDLIAKLHAHGKYRKKRLESGAMIRKWDPAFAEMVEHSSDLEAVLEEIENGIKVSVIGKTDRAIKVAQDHARIVTTFVEEGAVSVQRTHRISTESDEE